jgi:hypothetical protein
MAKKQIVKPKYTNLNGSGWDYFKTPTAKDSSNYKKGFEKAVTNKNIDQYPFPTSAEIRGYNEGQTVKKSKKAVVGVASKILSTYNSVKAKK